LGGKLIGAGDETRTRDIQLGRLTLYQLSYSRSFEKVVQGVGFEPTYGSRRPGLQPGAINHSTTLATVFIVASIDFLSQLANFQ
jgi:hypothetical protein